jgi:hypothetical protein
VKGYRKIARIRLRQFFNTKPPPSCVARLCLLDPGHFVRLRVLKLGEKVYREYFDPTDDYYEFPVWGASLYHTGKYPEAVQELSKSTSSPWSQFFLALAHHRLGELNEARQALAAALRLSDQPPKTKLTWQEKLELQVLRRKALACRGL